MASSQLPILFIDAYCSFANNIIALLEDELHRKVVKVHIDADVPDFVSFIRQFSAIVIGPGPGTVHNKEDTGLINYVWTLPEDALVPVFGVCLGFQSLCYQYGGIIERLPHPRHGIERLVKSSGETIFEGLESLSAVQYHSLHAKLGHEMSTEEGLASGALFEKTDRVPELVPLAWDVNLGLTEEDAVYSANPDRILMGVRHVSKPFYGVQFHPESICSSAGARQTIKNWWEIAKKWSAERATQVQSSAETVSTASVEAAVEVAAETEAAEEKSSISYTSTTISDICVDVPSIVSNLSIFHDDEEAVILDSARATPGLGQRCIIGCIDSSTLHVTYNVATKVVSLRQGSKQWTESLESYGGSAFKFLKSYLAERRLSPEQVAGRSDAFAGGFVGYIDYEACLETIDVAPPPTPAGRPNLHFVFVERSIVVDKENQDITIQSIRENDQAWVDASSRILSGEFLIQDLPSSGSSSTRDTSVSRAGDFTRQNSAEASAVASPYTSPELSDSENSAKDQGPIERSFTRALMRPSVVAPQEETYRSKIVACQDQLRAGNSYELCLTDQTKIQLPTPGLRSRSPWQLYSQLRTINPAPFAAYMRLGPVTIMSSSPERFMSWSRPAPATEASKDLTSVCQFRPIKGTVKKVQTAEDGSKRFVSLEEASAILSTQKERAENLMIVDLIRHDLYGVAGKGNVDVPQLMVIEEYQHVYQLVSVIEGRLPQPAKALPEAETRSGIDVLAKSLPPGSMTGAPKKRSCDMLTEIEENQPRSIYAGVLGYMDVCGGGDFSVVIRTFFRWDDECDGEHDTWRVGAGGAITILSTPQGEWEEMNAKLSTVLGLFEN